jgi:hypothetical protein
LWFHTLGMDALAIARHDFGLARAATMRPENRADHTELVPANYELLHVWVGIVVWRCWTAKPANVR